VRACIAAVLLAALVGGPTETAIARPSASLPSSSTTVAALDFNFVPGDNDLPPGTLVIHQGDTLGFLNLDPYPHNITADRDPSGHVAFASMTTTVSDHTIVDVAGVALLAPGTYGFHCGIHGVMQGTLIVMP